MRDAANGIRICESSATRLILVGPNFVIGYRPACVAVDQPFFGQAFNCHGDILIIFSCELEYACIWATSNWVFVMH